MGAKHVWETTVSSYSQRLSLLCAISKVYQLALSYEVIDILCTFYLQSVLPLLDKLFWAVAQNL